MKDNKNDSLSGRENCWFTIFGPTMPDPIKCKTWQDVTDWVSLYGPFEIDADEHDADTWDFAGGWFARTSH